MDELEQKCYDLDAKVRLVEEERDAVMTENDELQEQINSLRVLVESETSSSSFALAAARNLDAPNREEMLRLSEELARMDSAMALLKENLRTVNDKMREMGAMKESLRIISEETSCVKEDFLNLKNHLNIAAKIELQTNEKMYENRLHHLEKMLEEMRHREESFLHIAEETNILKDQVDSLRELSLNTLRCERSNYASFGAFCGAGDKNMTLNEELQYNNHDLSRSASLPISYDSPITELPQSPFLQQYQQQQQFPPPPAPENGAVLLRPSALLSSSSLTNSPFKITGQIKLSVTPAAAAARTTTSTTTFTSPMATQTESSQGRKKGGRMIVVDDCEKSKEYKFNCCLDLVARSWGQFFD